MIQNIIESFQRESFKENEFNIVNNMSMGLKTTGNKEVSYDTKLDGRENQSREL